MAIERHLFLGEPIQADPDENETITDDIVVIPVIAPRLDRVWSRGRVDHLAQIIDGDVSEALSMTGFEQAQADYNGLDTRATPTIGFDEVSAELYR